MAVTEPVLVLGAGINGCSLVRELVLNDIPVVLVDKGDIGLGATSRSSRLIHGGLRYLEYGEFALVKESLEERARLLHLAPQFVEPLQLFIPSRHLMGGLLASAGKFLGLSSKPKPGSRGMWLVRAGLKMYDTYAQDSNVPKAQVHSVTDPDVPQIDTHKYKHICSYYDAQMRYPERYIMALLEDARRVAKAKGNLCEILTYHQAEPMGDRYALAPLRGQGPFRSLLPSVVVNATGAWGDRTLASLKVDSKQLFGGTKGSHFLTDHPELKKRLGGKALYAEATDGRLVFVLPLGPSTLVGTTDIRYEDDPVTAVATPQELEYLVALVNDLFADLGLTTNDIAMHYSGVRPLPAAGNKAETAVSRGHWVEESRRNNVPILTLVGGKLTVGRSLAELACDHVLDHLGAERLDDTHERTVPGGEDYPKNERACEVLFAQWGEKFGVSRATIEELWPLYGTRLAKVFAECPKEPEGMLDGTNIPLAIVAWICANEWVESVDDLIERRLMLLYQSRLSLKAIDELVRMLVGQGKVGIDEMELTVEMTQAHLLEHFGKRVVRDDVETPAAAADAPNQPTLEGEE